MADARREVVSSSSSFYEDFGKLSLSRSHHAPQVPITDFVDGYENPVAWHKKYSVLGDQLTKDVLFDNTDMKNITLAQYGHDKPEYIKWKLFGYNIVICYEYISKLKANKALKIIDDIENILSSIGSNDTFLKSIRIALNHITFSMKGHVLKLCSLDTTNLEHFVMPNNMNNVNKAALFGVQSLFFYEYGLPCAHISKDTALKAITLNKGEAEWHFLMAKVLTHWQRTCGNYSECSEQEIHAAETAVKLANKDHHKLHLVHIYHRMSKNIRRNVGIKKEILDTGLKLINEVMSNTNDLLLLKNCLLSLSKIALERGNNSNSSEILEKLIDKLGSSSNSYIHGAIGNYYLFNKKDYERAKFHLKKAYDAKSFGCSIDYIYTLFKLNPETAPVEQMMVDLLKFFTHPVHREKIVSQIVSYLILTKNDLIQAIKYVPMLLSTKNITCVYSLRSHRVKFTNQNCKQINLLEVLSESLDAALKDPTLPADNKKRIIEVVQILVPYKQYVIDLMKDKEHIFGNNFKKDSEAKNDAQFNNNNKHEESWTYKNPKRDMANEKKRDEGNWRTLKPDPKPNPSIFSNGYQKQISNSGMEIKSRFNYNK